jgi:hypothetical protein
MSKIRDMELMGLRELTDAEVGFLMTSRNYAGAILFKFIGMAKDAAALDLHTESEAETLMEKMRRCVTKASLNRHLQVYQQGKTLIISKVKYGEDLKLTPEQEATFR